jgi:xanthine dehydrogenase YagR molybdenum-binding subunit
MQPIALVLAETFEQARYAARLVKATYNEEKPMTRVEDALDKAFDPPGSALKPRGKPAEAFKAAPVKIEAVYTIPMEHHNPMEPHGAIAFWENDKLTIFDKTQDVNVARQHLAASFSLPNENVQVISPFVGGAFGSSLRPNYYPALAAAAARELKRPVKLVYTRTQMFTGHGYRPYTWQKVALGAERDGKLTSMIHEAVKNASTFKDWTDGTTDLTRPLYACSNADTPNRIVKTDFATPESMRAPGAVSGMFALECAMDELAYALKMDPLELRLVNFTDVHPDSGKPYSSKALRECYRLGAKKFGCKNRKFEPRSMRDGRFLVGWGMATGVWGAWQRPAGVKITLKPDGTAHVASATSDIGPGTYTVMTLIAAEYLGLSAENVKFELGDTRFPPAPVQGGSFTTASVGTAIYESAQNIKRTLLDLANKDVASPFRTAKNDDVEMLDGKLQIKNDPSQSVNISELMRRNNLSELVDVHEAKPSPEREKYAIGAHGAQFVEVKVDPDLGIVRVTRVIEVTASGKIMNPKTAHSQELGGIVWGIGMALQEATEIDHRYGRIMNPNLQHYHVPVNADILDYETIFVEEDDKIINPLGVKGMGELCQVGIPAAIANAVFHATGKRVRDLPITPDKLIG